MYSDKNGLEYPIIAAVYRDIGIIFVVDPVFKRTRGLVS